MEKDLSARWLREPQRPVIYQWVLDVEVFRVVENGNLFGVFIFSLWSAAIRRCIFIRRLATFRGDRNGIERDW